MAQQRGSIQIVGKLANMVGFKNSASEKKNPYFAREYTSIVSNPKTQRQARQRAKAKPAQMFYQAAEAVLNHAFIPLGRASKNRNKFLSYAMSLDAVPDIPKGESFLPALPYQISEGALGLDFLTEGNASADSSDNSLVLFPIKSLMEIAFQPEEITTVGTLAGALIGNSNGLQAGMELTFVAVIARSNNSKNRILQHFSVVLDPGDSLTTADDIVGNKFIGVNFGSNYASLYSTNRDYQLLAGGLIISAKSSNSWRYTNSKMVLALAAETMRAYTEAEVLASYMDSESSRSSDLILQQADNSVATNEVRITSIQNVEYTTTVGGTKNYDTLAVAVYSDGTRKVIVNNNGTRINSILHWNGGSDFALITSTTTSEPPVVVEIKLGNTNFAGAPTIEERDVVVPDTNPRVYALTIQNRGIGGSVSPSGTVIVTAGQSITLDAGVEPGATFEGYYNAQGTLLSSSATWTFTPSDDMYIEARFSN